MNVADTAGILESQLYAAYHAVIALEPEAAGDRDINDNRIG
jgi:hypothetical protein